METLTDASRSCLDVPATLSCMQNVRLGKLPISVTKLSGENIEFEVSWDESVAKLKMRLGQIVGVTPCRQELLCGACVLENHRQLESYAHQVPLALTLLVRQELSKEVVNNTKNLVTALRVGMAPRPCRLQGIVYSRTLLPMKRFTAFSPSSGAPVNEQPSQLCIHAHARKLVPGRTPAARKLRELRRKTLAHKLRPKALAPPFCWRTRHRYYLEDCYEQPSWAGLAADVERTIRHCEVDLEGFQVLKLALRMGCGELALFCLRHGADPTAVSLHEATKYFHGRRRLLPSDPLIPSPGTVFRNPAEGFTLVRAICDLWRRQAAINKPPVDALAAARSRLARATTELALLRPWGGERITKQEVAQAAGLPWVELDAFGDDLWAGWPTAFLTFSEPMLGTCKRMDPIFIRARACLVASTVCQPRLCPQRKIVHWYDDDDRYERSGPEPDLNLLINEYDLQKCRNQKWRDCYVTKRRVRRVPWTTGNGTSASRSSRLARRLPKSASHIWGKGRRHMKNQLLDWDGELLDPIGEYYMPNPKPDVDEIGRFLPVAPSARLFGMWTVNLKQNS
mmetsp:Transcript_31946/g.62827  ORF Transcript_31946/g.62827 Transcript_31946/m.62827 type:complete len:567 (-) Transcript_31946:209-1909(-)|eukprot:CAMPEP_0172727846 /NCGR_PEP_ID=MMETSP1074-20121228/91900_1 /TAXON_ID=2916 /ORGANISM="Ceratium fusus, Strain PA161109" /LENGTH=566 /DNA_ID=CAMNT_0013555027 /DNA_START=77 /DNA_END=1777 /DNA_ORIENTATION=+